MSPDQPPELPTPPDVAAEQQFAEQRAKAEEATRDSEPRAAGDGVVDQARELFHALVRAEFHLARNSALFLFAMSCVLIVLGVGTWLGLLALLIAGVARVSGSWSIGIGSVVLINSIGGVWVFTLIRREKADRVTP